MKEIHHDKKHIVEKFKRSSEEIFADKIYSGCSDIATSLATVLRLKGIPTIYVQAAKVDWVNELHKHLDTLHQGYVFLELYF